MDSAFAWLDSNLEQNKKMRELIASFNESQSRDELGLGSLRDRIADTLFPGTSTLQTKIKYFLFIPWMFLKLEQKKNINKNPDKLLRIIEGKLIYSLTNSNEQYGIIGRIAGADKIQRLSSSVYWNGLRNWKILENDRGSSYFVNQDYYTFSDGIKDDLDSNESQFKDKKSFCWNSDLPPVPDDFPNNINFTLTPTESNYLYQKIQAHCADSYLAYLFKYRKKITFGDFPWGNTHESVQLPDSLKQQLLLAEYFSHCSRAGYLAYYWKLAELKGNMDNLQIHLEEESDKWRAEQSSKWNSSKLTDDLYIKAFNIFGDERNISDSLRFLLLMKNLLSKSTLSPIKNKPFIEEIIKRESSIKGQRSRITNPRKREIWQASSVPDYQKFRWSTVTGFIADLKRHQDV